MVVILSNEFEYIERNDVSFMYVESDYESELLGEFRINPDGYYVFHPKGVAMTCKALREAAKKASSLNDGLD